MNSTTVQTIFNSSARLIEQCGMQFADELLAAGRDMITCFEQGGKILICGNGGSAAEAQHFAAEIVNKLAVYRRALPALSLATDTSTLTSIANDLDFESIFARQVEALGQKGDILWALSTSGSSANIIKACTIAQSRNMKILSFTGQPGSQLESMANRALVVPDANTARVQEVHLCYGHLLCLQIERYYLDQQTAKP
jgi:D-sedoheptulose 7-phosphate isomerase